MATHVCTKCGTKYSPGYASNWGKTASSDGMGPVPRCTHLIEAPDAPKAPKRSANGETEYETPLQVCGGMLAFSATGTTVDDKEDAAPIDPNRKR